MVLDYLETRVTNYDNWGQLNGLKAFVPHLSLLIQLQARFSLLLSAFLF
jgi:hypothetical protein